jgi:hypothetical protein
MGVSFGEKKLHQTKIERFVDVAGTFGGHDPRLAMGPFEGVMHH